MLKYISDFFTKEELSLKENFFYSSLSEPFFNEIYVNRFDDYKDIKNKISNLYLGSLSKNLIIECLEKLHKEESENLTLQLDFIYFKNQDCPVLKILNKNSRINKKKYNNTFNKFYIKEFIFKKNTKFFLF